MVQIGFCQYCPHTVFDARRDGQVKCVSRVTLGRSTFQPHLNVTTPDKSQPRITHSLGHYRLRLGMVFWEGIGSTKTIANGEAKAHC